MWRKLLLLYVPLLLLGCSHRQIKKELALFSKTEVQIPSDMIMFQNGILQDSVCEIHSHLIKLIIYYGGDDCTSCRVSHLYELDQLFDLQIDKRLFSPVIIMTPDKQHYNEFYKILVGQPYAFPIYIDNNDNFRRLNSDLPKNSRYHTFLLDRTNHVILVGDPLVGDAMWKLFKSTLDNMLAHDGLYVPEQ